MQTRVLNTNKSLQNKQTRVINTNKSSQNKQTRVKNTNKSSPKKQTRVRNTNKSLQSNQTRVRHWELLIVLLCPNWNSALTHPILLEFISQIALNDIGNTERVTINLSV